MEFGQASRAFYKGITNVQGTKPTYQARSHNDGFPVESRPLKDTASWGQSDSSRKGGKKIFFSRGQYCDTQK